MTKPWLCLSIVVGLVFMLATPILADFQAGVDAYKRGDYDTALKEFRLLAEQGDTSAQNNLGLMYGNGQGVPQDYQEAVRWFRLAAEQGFALAKNNLGAMYIDGKGVSTDYIQAYLWMTLAAEQGFGPAKELLETLQKKMTPDQIAEAQRLAREWKARGK